MKKETYQFITPADKRTGKDVAKLQKRQVVMNQKKEIYPNRWAKRRIRDWSPITNNYLDKFRIRP
ncbi:hypothetical protein [Thorsellia kenyensis]|uniref:Uncharacterized protein n=1 Tax=Thorsellia kenyensis TaxID=1549888 RepID=A0ABV6CBZ4_9GAMM